ncbi:uncharacterized protein LOC128558417 [Mercenaria mercenaria]|uniref:uncharacterized protein LOC128558417 n=1 Tax=Mercenaria mercenaria TaxID=6596 RepID=UPI00234F1664|nr:uncharacterized protein LOC128558417 [Mercenaria mercenaria]
MASTYSDLVHGEWCEYNERGEFRRQRGYAPNRKLYYCPGASISSTVDDLVDDVDDIIKSVENNRGPVDEFVIGKSFARKKKNKDFDPENFKTWKLDGGVNGRWNNKYRPEGFDGLIVLCAFTKGSLPRDCGSGLLHNHQDYSHAIEQALITYYAFKEKDRKLGNRSLCTGRAERNNAKAYVIYVAFKLERGYF